MCEGILPGAEPTNHVAPASPPGPWRAAAGTATAEKPAESNCDAGDKRKLVDELKPSGAMEADTCFPACMNDGGDGNQKEVRLVGPQTKISVELETKASDGMGVMDTPPPTTSSGRRSQRNSRRMSSDNQYEGFLGTGGPNFDLEDVAKGVLSPLDYRSLPMPPGSIVVDYDEGMPERSRTGLLKDGSIDGSGKAVVDGASSGDCAPEACNPLDALSFEELAIEDTRIPRPRLGSTSQPKTPSRRGKSVVLSSATEPPAKVSKPVEEKKKKQQEPDEALERCSTMHKLCLCEVRLHKSRESCWLVANNSVYDVTGLVDSHPAGPRSIMRKAGGPDCTKDMKFHSKAARKMLEKCFIGKLAPCGEDPTEADGPAACTIM